MLSITSLQNPKIKDLLKLKESRHRRASGLFLVEGARELERALQGGFELLSLYVCAEFLSPLALRLYDRIENRLKININPEIFAKIAVRTEVDGLLAVLVAKKWSWSDLPILDNSLYLVLENIEKPGNLGALARSADGAGVDAIIVLDPNADLFNHHAIRASLGGLFSRPILACSVENFTDACVERRVRIVTASPFAEKYHFEEDLAGSLAIVLGSEAWGLSESWNRLEHRAVKIPMRGLGDSLNVSVAGAVIMYEALRQRLKE